MKLTQNIGRMLLGSFFLFSAIHSFFGFNDFVELVKSKNIPLPIIVSLIVLICKLITGILIISNDYENYNISASIIFVFTVTIMYHNAFVDNTQFNNMMKNLAIIGGLMFLYK